MSKLKKSEQVKLLEQIALDLKVATGQSHSAAKRAVNDIKSGRPDDCLQAMLEIEPKLYDAKKLFNLATYVNGLGKYGKE